MKLHLVIALIFSLVTSMANASACSMNMMPDVAASTGATPCAMHQAVDAEQTAEAQCESACFMCHAVTTIYLDSRISSPASSIPSTHVKTGDVVRISKSLLRPPIS